MLQRIERGWSASAVHDTVQAVLRDPAFRRSLRRSLGDRLLVWVVEWLDQLGRVLRHLPSMRSLALALVALIVLFVAARFIIAARVRDERGVRSARRSGTTSSDDAWQLTDTLMGQGRYEEAAHTMYRGVLLTLAREERLRLDPSKTSGDYARELRRRGAVSLVPFRTFTRRFEISVYGHGGYNAASLEELRTLSAPFRPSVRAA